MMSFALTLWVISLVSLATLTGAGAYLFAKRRLLPVEVPKDLSELLSGEIHYVVRHSHAKISTFYPHARIVSRTLVSLGIRGRDIFAERVFGRMHLERGKASSFFLKYIAEHKEMPRRGREVERM